MSGKKRIKIMSEFVSNSIHIKLYQHKERLFLYAMSLLCLLSVTRIYRNSVKYESMQQGGVWNIITLIFWIIAVIVIITRGKKILNEIPICLAVLYSLTAQFNAFAQIRVFSIFNVYNIMMLSFFTCVMIVFYHAYHGPLLHKELLFVRGCVLFIFTFRFLFHVCLSDKYNWVFFSCRCILCSLYFTILLYGRKEYAVTQSRLLDRRNNNYFFKQAHRTDCFRVICHAYLHR